VRNRLSTLVAATAMVAGSALLTAQPAAADVPCTISAYGPRTVVVGLSAVTSELGVETSDCSTVNHWSIFIDGTPSYGYTYLLYARTSAPSFTFAPGYLFNADAGYRWDAEVDVHNGDDTATMATFADSFVVKRATAISSFDASPEPVTKGRPITVKGLLRSADWDQGRYVPLRYASVRVQFKASGTTTWSTVKTVKSSSTGWVNTTVTATVDGYWRLYYAGGSKFGSRVTGSDFVNVS
jgi:hypothetical protein